MPRTGDHVQALSRILCRLFAQRLNQAQFIQCRRTQIIHGSPDIGDDAPNVITQFGGLNDSRIRIAGYEMSQQTCLQAQCCQHWPDAIMQVAAQAAAFFFTRGYQALTRSLQVGGELHGVGG